MRPSFMTSNLVMFGTPVTAPVPSAKVPLTGAAVNGLASVATVLADAAGEGPTAEAGWAATPTPRTIDVADAVVKGQRPCLVHDLPPSPLMLMSMRMFMNFPRIVAAH